MQQCENFRIRCILWKFVLSFRRYTNLNIDGSVFFFSFRSLFAEAKKLEWSKLKVFFNVPLAERGYFSSCRPGKCKIWKKPPRIKIIPLLKSAKASFHLKNEDIYLCPGGSRTARSHLLRGKLCWIATREKRRKRRRKQKTILRIPVFNWFISYHVHMWWFAFHCLFIYSFFTGKEIPISTKSDTFVKILNATMYETKWKIIGRY